MNKRNPLLLLAFFVATMSQSCKKEKDPVEPPVLTKKEILVKNTWQVDEIQRSIEGVNSYYIKGGTNTTGVNYNLIRLTFNNDGTGSYIDEVGISHTTTWKFTSANEYNMELKVGPPSAQTFNWTLVEITEKALYNTTAVGSDVLVSARYIPLP